VSSLVCSIADPDDTALGRLSATRNTCVHEEQPNTGSLGKAKGLAALASANPSSFMVAGVDLNQRPLGYEPFSNRH